MKFIVWNIDEITDSREILEAKPNLFGIIFIYILLSLIGVIVVWSLFTEKEILIKTTGVVVPRQGVYKLCNPKDGVVKSINFEDGQYVKEGDVLYIIENYYDSENINIFNVKAPKDGIIQIKTNLIQGEIIKEGNNIINIIPDDNNYMVEFKIDEKYISNIDENQSIRCSFKALPYKKYGYLEGKIDNLSKGSNIIDESGIKYYTGYSYINDNKLYSKKGKESSIENGMSSDIQIITEKERMIDYILKKVNIK